MDTRRHLILVKGEDRTREIASCQRHMDTRRVHITFNNGREYPYSQESIVWLQDHPYLVRERRDTKSSLEGRIPILQDSLQGSHSTIRPRDRTHRGASHAGKSGRHPRG